MTVTSPQRSGGDLEWSTRVYRSLLIAYPRAFRAEYGDDLVQAFGDLLFSAKRRGLWRRTLWDLFTSASKERGSAILGGRPPIATLAFIVLAGAIAVGFAGPGVRSILPVLGVLIALPAFGGSQLHRAWLVRRTTGESATAPMIVGILAFAPAAVFLLAAGPDRGFWIVAAGGLTLIVGSIFGVIWAITNLLTRSRVGDNRRRRAVLVLAAAVVVLGVIAGGSYNSYRRSQPPAGDHSVEGASAETRALWDAAGAGDVDAVIRLSRTCADPWVQFPIGNDKRNARGYADQRLLDLPDEQEGPYREINDVLAETQDTWFERCGAPTD